MARTLAEVLAELEGSKYTRAVWTEVVTMLAGAIDEEVRSASKGITAENCTSQYVPQKVILQIIDDIRNHKIAPLDVKIEEIESMSVPETKDVKKSSPKKVTTEGAKSKPTTVRTLRPRARKKVKNSGGAG